MSGRKTHDVFLSHYSGDKASVEKLAKRLLTEMDINPWLDKWNLVPGDPWQEALEQALDNSRTCAVFIGPGRIGPWQNEEMRSALDSRVKDRNFRVIPVLLPGAKLPERGELPRFLSRLTWVDFRHGLQDEEAFRRFVAGIRGIQPGPQANTISSGPDLVCPYRGLEKFEEEHARFFFGREAITQHLVETLRSTRFLTVLGPSGSGKSSLVRAGLIPRLKAGIFPESSKWTYITITPGSDPIEEVSLHLPLGDRRDIELLDTLRSDQRGLHLHVRRLLKDQPRQMRVFLLIDQFEETFTLCQDHSKRQQFIDNIRFAAMSVEGQLVIVLAMRADFMARASEYTELAELMSGHQFVVSPMDEVELKSAIEDPAQLVGLSFEDGLVSRIVREVGREPGALPLLEHTLLQLCEKRSDENVMTAQAYDELGGVQGALAKRADEIYRSFSPEQQAITRRIMLRLTQPGEGTEDTRRRATMSELIVDSDEIPVVESVIKALTDARLLTTNRVEELEKRIIDVSHEALIRGWPELRKWIEEDREGLRLQHQLARAAEEWRSRRGDESMLYRGARLLQTTEWVASAKPSLSRLERDFITSGTALQTREEKARRFRLRVAVALLVIAVLSAIFANYQRRVAQAELKRNAKLLYVSDISLAQQMHAMGNMLRAHQLLEAYLSDGQDLRGFEWYYLMAQYHNERTTLKGHNEFVTSVAFSPDGRTVAAGSLNDTVILWDVATRKELTRIDRNELVAFSPDGKLLATAGGRAYDSEARLWDTGTYKEIAKVEDLKHDVKTISFLAGGNTLALACSNGSIVLWDVATRKTQKTLEIPDRFISEAAFSPDGNTVAISGLKKPLDDQYVPGDAYEVIKLWDIGAGKELGTFSGHRFRVHSIAFSPDGKTLLTCGGDGTIKLWEVATQKELATLQGYKGGTQSAVFSPQGNLFASCDRDKTLKLWDVAERRILAVFEGHSNILTRVVFSQDGKTLATGSLDHTVKLWDVPGQVAVSQDLPRPQVRVSHSVFTSGGIVATAVDEGNVTVWDMSQQKKIAVINTAASDPAGAEKKYTAVIAISPDAKMLASSILNKTIKLWDIANQKEIGTLTGHESFVDALEFSPDGRILAAADSDGKVKLWRVADMKEQATLTVIEPIEGMPQYYSRSVSALAFSPDGRMLATGDLFHAVKLWDLNSHKQLLSLEGHTESISVVAFSADGKTLASGGLDNLITLWSVDTGDVLATFNGHEHYISGLAFSPDGKTLASSSSDGSVKLWNIPAQKELATFDAAQTGDESAIAFTSDGSMLITVSVDNKIKSWRAASESEIKARLNLD